MNSSARICLFRSTAAAVLLFTVGCNNSAEWQPGDEDNLRKLVSEVSDARSDSKKLGELFTAEATPDSQWLRKTEGRSFVVNEIELSGDNASLQIELEDHFGEVQGSITWKCARQDEGWLISSAPLD